MPTSAVVHFAAAERQADTAAWGEPNLRAWRADYVEALLELGRTEDAVALLDDLGGGSGAGRTYVGAGTGDALPRPRGRGAR